jgi:hypothetical protein
MAKRTRLGRFVRKVRAAVRRRRRAAPKVRTRTRTVFVPAPRKGSRRSPGVENTVVTLLKNAVPAAVGVIAAGLAVRAIPRLDTPTKRAAGAAALAVGAALLQRPIAQALPFVGSKAVSLFALGAGMDAAWRLALPLRDRLPGLPQGGASGGLLAGSSRYSRSRTAYGDRLATLTQ